MKLRLKSSLWIFVSTLFLTVFLVGCVAQESQTTQDQKFRNLTRELFCQEVTSNTISLHYTLEQPKEYGINQIPLTFGDISTDQEAAGAVIENTLAAVKVFDEENLSAENRLTKEVLSSYLENARGGLPYTMYQEPLSTVNGVQSQIPVLLTEFRFENQQDVEMYLGLIDTLPEYFKSVMSFEKKKAEQGLFMSDAIADDVIKQCQAFVNMGNQNYLISTFVDRIKILDVLDDSTRDYYIQKNAKAVMETMRKAYTYLIEEVRKLKGHGVNAGGLCYYPEGKAYYTYLARQQTGSNRSVEGMKALAKNQIMDDLKAMEKELGIEAPTASMETTATMKKNNPVVMLSDLQKKIEKAFPSAPGVTARVKYVPKAMEHVLSPAFYMIPPIDNISENVIYVNEAQVTNPLSLYTTLAHEGYPGHLYQTTYYANQNPDEIRTILNYGGYVEGWATYCEMMSYYLAPITKTQAILCQKNGSIILGLYAIADIGIHYDGWMQADTVRFFQSYGIGDEDVISDIYNLILGDPGNYLKYYIGYLEFLNLKKDVAKQLGSKFSQEQFHEAVLKCGPAPFEIVREQVHEACIK